MIQLLNGTKFQQREKEVKGNEIPCLFRVNSTLLRVLQSPPRSVELHDERADLMKLLFHIKFLLLKIKSCLRAKLSRKKDILSKI